MVNVYILCEGQTEEQFVKQVLYPTVSRIQAIRTAYPSPEFIDDSPDTAPSKRIKSLIPAYKKVADWNRFSRTNRNRPNSSGMSAFPRMGRKNQSPDRVIRFPESAD